MNCQNFIIKNKWEKVKICPLCHSRRKFYYFNYSIKCAKCRKIFSIRRDTVFQNSKISLEKWFKAIEYVTDSKENHNSIRLSRYIEVTQKTAYYMLSKMKESGVINSRLTKHIRKQNDDLENEYIRSKFLMIRRPTIQGQNRMPYEYLSDRKKEFYNDLKQKIKELEEANKKRLTPYEAALMRAIYSSGSLMYIMGQYCI